MGSVILNHEVAQSETLQFVDKHKFNLIKSCKRIAKTYFAHSKPEGFLAKWLYEPPHTILSSAIVPLPKMYGVQTCIEDIKTRLTSN